MTETDPDRQYSDDGERENPDGPRPEDEQDDEAREEAASSRPGDVSAH
ncbi:MAG: hypothetical protein WBM72_08230 [Actinomycetota bacterium]